MERQERKKETISKQDDAVHRQREERGQTGELSSKPGCEHKGSFSRAMDRTAGLKREILAGGDGKGSRSGNPSHFKRLHNSAELPTKYKRC